MSSEDLKKPGGLRKRIIGATVLVALLVILLPLFLNHVPQTVYVSKMVKQPPASGVKPITSADFTGAARNQVTAIGDVWALQLGSFTEFANAKQLVQTLQKQGYPAYMHKVTNGDRIVYKVFVGPETDRNTVQMWLDALKKKNLPGTIVPYVVVSS